MTAPTSPVWMPGRSHQGRDRRAWAGAAAGPCALLRLYLDGHPVTSSSAVSAGACLLEPVPLMG